MQACHVPWVVRRLSGGVRRALFLLGALLPLATAPLAGARAQAVVRAEAQSDTLDCRGGDARVEGNHNRLTLRGACRSLELFGNANVVQVELAAGTRVRVEGQDNRVTYTVARGGQPPQVSVAGVNSVVAPAAQAQAPSGPLLSSLPAPTRPEPPRPEPVQPEPPRPAPRPVQPVPRAAPAVPALPPSATPLVPAAPPPAAALPSAPVASSAAPGPATLPSTPPVLPAEPTSGPLAIRGDDQQREVDCTGRDAVIEGNRGSYLLRGGCRSLRVTGALATVRAELQPGARVQIDGSGVTVHWRLASPGSPPLVAIRGEGNRAVRAGPRGY